MCKLISLSLIFEFIKLKQNKYTSIPKFFPGFSVYIIVQIIYLMKYAIVLPFFIITSANTTAQIITTVAGCDSSYRFAGDGRQATTATLNRPYKVTIDASGNLYVADGANFRIRKVDASGIIITIAGIGTSGFSGDGGRATAANISPAGMAFDRSGNLIFCDVDNNRIRKVDTHGIISTIAGTGVSGYSGDGGPATAAQFANPGDIAIDSSGNIYVADQLNACVRKINNSGIISSVAGGGVSGLGDGGPATSAVLVNPYGITVDRDGNLYIADVNNNRVRKVDTSGIITTIAGRTGLVGCSGDGGPATIADISFPTAVAVDARGNIFFTEAMCSSVRMINTSGTISTVAGTIGHNGFDGDGGPATAAHLNNPTDVKVDLSGSIYICDQANARVRYVKSILSINKIGKVGIDVKLNPNPSNGAITVSINSRPHEQFQITIINAVGQRVKGLTAVSGTPVNIQLDLPAGVYYCIVTDSENFACQQFEIR